MKIFWRWVQRQKESFDIFEKLIKAISSTSRDVTNYSVNLLSPTLQKKSRAATANLFSAKLPMDLENKEVTISWTTKFLLNY